jgi:hypothetical protein
VSLHASMEYRLAQASGLCAERIAFQVGSEPSKIADDVPLARMLFSRAAGISSAAAVCRASKRTCFRISLSHIVCSRRKQHTMSTSATQAPAGPPGPERDGPGDRSGPEALKEALGRAPELLSKAGPTRGVDTSGPTAGLVAKVQELKQRLEDTPGTSTTDRCG